MTCLAIGYSTYVALVKTEGCSMDAKNGISWTPCLVGGASALQQFKAQNLDIHPRSSGSMLAKMKKVTQQSLVNRGGKDKHTEEAL
ncbi:hypothetical protein POTOM_038386 [Populus tomentosa]|uniref:Uncharacterized protein n=1 Tax=Populus tomentosa TaxID=118781 RepID=A0A8X7YSD1_POPTO|nr:hypothetical protein POTOM_038386 [Populus tomentosa]